MNHRSPHFFATLGTALALSISFTAKADVYFTESFDYAEGDLGDVSSWELGPQHGVHFSVISAGLSHPHLPGSFGGAAHGPDRTASQIGLGQTFGNVDETIYVSYLMQTDSRDVDIADWGAFQVLELWNGGERNYFAGLLRSAGTTTSNEFEHRIWNHGTSGPPASFGDFTPETSLVVLKFDWTNAGDALTIDVWLDPNDITDFNAESNRLLMLSDAIKFDTVVLQSTGDATDPINFDEIRIADTAPTLVPEPASAALLVVGAGVMMLRRRRH